MEMHRIVSAMGSHCKKVLQRCDFNFTQIRVPGLEYQYYAIAIAAIPGFMLEAVIKCQYFPHLPGTRFITHPDAAVIRNDQAQVHSQAYVHLPIVGNDVCIGLDTREKHFRHIGARLWLRD